MSAPNWIKLRMKLWLGRRINEERALYRAGGKSNKEFNEWLQRLAGETGLTVKTLRNWACWARDPDPVDAYERHLYVDREGARWRREIRARSEELGAGSAAYERQAEG
jgi:hypothetical protein